MMRAFPSEYRFRYLLHILLYALGFYAPWERYTSLTLGEPTWWLTLASLPARAGWFSFAAASRYLLVFACVTATLGALLRVWGSAYLGSSVVQSGSMHGDQLIADGPFRHVRNPLYLGTFLNVLALSLLMPPTGAIFAIVTIGTLQLRLIGAEEQFLAAKVGAPYVAYLQQVPRLLPSLRPRIPASGRRPRWANGVLVEVFFLGCAVSFLTLGSSYNSVPIIKGVLISLGLSLIAKAAAPRSDTIASTRTNR